VLNEKVHVLVFYQLLNTFTFMWLSSKRQKCKN